MSTFSSSDKLLKLVDPIAYKTARQYAGRIPHLSFEDVAGEIRLKLMRAIKQSPRPPFLKQVAKSTAIDLIRAGKSRRHDELESVVAVDEDGDEVTLGDLLAENGHPDLTSPSAEEEYLKVEIRQRIKQEIPSRAREIGQQRLLGQTSSDADNAYIASYRKKFPPKKKADLFDYYS
jgi:DNA-directed RNA polymerase specialized sigma24 family protein